MHNQTVYILPFIWKKLTTLTIANVPNSQNLPYFKCR